MGSKDLNKEKLAVLHRHWMWANIMRENFDLEIEKGHAQKRPQDFFPDRIGAYMCLWYGMLYGVLEVVKEKQLTIPGLEDLDSIYNALKRFRNAIFHPQPKYWSPKLFEIMKDEQSVMKIRNIHSALGKYFLDQIRNKEG